MKLDRRIFVPALACLAAIAGVVLRLWDLRAGSRGLPNTVFLAASLGCLALFLALAVTSPGRSGRYQVLAGGGFPVSIAAGVLILAGVGLEFAETLLAGPTAFAAVICPLGILGGICCLIAASARRQGTRRYPAAELLPIAYLLIKLIYNFKGWSIDPIISDYVVILFALIFALLAFHRGAGFFFHQGKPRATLFFAMAAVYFGAAAAMDGLVSRSYSTLITYCGFALWQLPVIAYLSVPRKAPKTQKADNAES